MFGFSRSWLPLTAALLVWQAQPRLQVINAAPASSQEAVPTGAELVRRHIAAIGGQAAFAAVKSMRARGRLELVSQKIGGDLEVLSARPAKLLHRVTIPGIGRIENGYDGTVAWSLSPIAGPELLTGRQLSEAADD